MKMTDAERKRCADKSREMQKKDPELTLIEIAPKLGISEGHLCRLRKKFPPENSPPDEDEALKDVLDAFQEEFETNESFYREDEVIEENENQELVRGYIVNENESFFNSIPFEIFIPAGLEGRNRSIVIHSTVFKDLEVIEI